MLLYFVRHGNTFNSTETPTQIGCKTDIPLTKKGISQIQQLKEHFLSQENHFDICFCGPLKRHIQSAKILSEQIKIMDELNEIDYGKWENLTSEQIESSWPEQYYKWQTQAIWPNKIFNGNQNQCAQNLSSLINYITTVSNYNKTGKSLIVSSQGTIRYLLFLSGKWDNIIKNKSMLEYKIKPGNYCIVEVNKDDFNIINWNISYNSNNP